MGSVAGAMSKGRNGTAPSGADFHRPGSMRMPPTIRQAVATTIAVAQSLAPLAMFSRLSIATSITKPTPPKKLSAVSVLDVRVRLALNAERSPIGAAVDLAADVPGQTLEGPKALALR